MPFDPRYRPKRFNGSKRALGEGGGTIFLIELLEAAIRGILWTAKKVRRWFQD